MHDCTDVCGTMLALISIYNVILLIAEAEVEIIEVYDNTDNDRTSYVSVYSSDTDHQGNEAEKHVYDIIPDYVNDETINMKGNVAYSVS